MSKASRRERDAYVDAQIAQQRAVYRLALGILVAVVLIVIVLAVWGLLTNGVSPPP